VHYRAIAVDYLHNTPGQCAVNKRAEYGRMMAVLNATG
jgi:hypothetical protein